MDWKTEALAQGGVFLAIPVIFASGAFAAMVSQESEQYRVLRDNIERVDGELEREAAAEVFLAHISISAFIEPADELIRALGYRAEVPIVDCIELIVKRRLVATLLVMATVPVAAEPIGRALGYGRDSHRATRPVWRFDPVCLLRLALNGVSLIRAGACIGPYSTGAKAAICGFLQGAPCHTTLCKDC